MATYRNLDRISPFSNSNVSLGQSKIAELLSKKLVWLGADSDHNKHHPPQQASNKPAKNDLKTTFAAKPNEIAPSSDPNSAFEISSTCSSIPFGITDIDLELPDGGLRRGAIHEFFYKDPLLPKASAAAIPILLAHNAIESELAKLTESRSFSSYKKQPSPQPSIAWIGKHSWPSPQAISSFSSTSSSSKGRDLLTRSLFIDPQNDATTLWAIELALRSPAITLIIASCPRINRATSQRLALLAKKHLTTAILLRSSNELSIPSHAKSRWIISPTPTNNRSPAWNLALHKLKGCTSLRKNWILAINEPDLFAPYAPIYSQPDQKDQVEFAVTDTASVKLSEYQFLFYGHA